MSGFELLPSLTDGVALLGIDVVLCAIFLRLCAGRGRLPLPRWARLATAGLLLLLWWPAGPAGLPLLAAVRGISSDFSVTLVLLAGLGAWRRWRGMPALPRRELSALYGAVAVAAVFLYPLALGWTDWDAYRLGWGSLGLWSGLLAVSVAAWVCGLRLLPGMIAAGLLGWSFGLLESANLWDYLLDPWLAVAAWVHCIGLAVRWLPGLPGRRQGRALPARSHG